MEYNKAIFYNQSKVLCGKISYINKENMTGRWFFEQIRTQIIMWYPCSGAYGSRYGDRKDCRGRE